MDDEDLTARWQDRFEVLAGLVLVVAVGLVASAALGAWASLDFDARFGGGDGVDVVEVLRLAAQSATPLTGGLLAVVYLLILQGPGERIGRLGRLVLGSLVWCGLALAALAAGAAIDLAFDRGGNRPMSSARTVLLDYPGPGGLERAASLLPHALAAALCGYVAWLAWSALPAARAASDAVGDAEEAGPADGPHAPGQPEGGHDPGDDTEPEPG